MKQLRPLPRYALVSAAAAAATAATVWSSDESVDTSVTYASLPPVERSSLPPVERGPARRVRVATFILSAKRHRRRRSFELRLLRSFLRGIPLPRVPSPRCFCTISHGDQEHYIKPGAITLYHRSLSTLTAITCLFMRPPSE